jgi:hypothetical protein
MRENDNIVLRKSEPDFSPLNRSGLQVCLKTGSSKGETSYRSFVDSQKALWYCFAKYLFDCYVCVSAPVACRPIPIYKELL